MADNVTADAGAGGATFAADDIGGVHYPRTKIVLGADGAADNDVDAGQQAMAASVPVVIASDQSAVAISHAALTELAAAIDTELQVDIVGAIPAGNNNIGDIDVASIAAGDNNIGNVDIASIAAGDNNIGNVDIVTVIAGTGATNLGKAIDAVAGATDTGVAILAVRDDALSALTPAEGDYVPLRTGSTGALWVTAVAGDAQKVLGTDTYTEATTQGVVIGAIRRDADTTLVNTTNEVAPLQVDANGYLKVEVFDGGGSHTVDNAGTFAVQVDGSALTALQLIDDAIFAEDVAAQAADKGMAVLAVRRDADTSLVGTDNDYANLQVDANGYLKVEIFDGGGSHTVDNAGTFAVQVDGSALTALQLIDDIVKTDDAAFTAGTDEVAMAGFIADETPTGDSADSGDAIAVRATLDRKLIVSPEPHTNGGLVIFRSLDLDETEEEVKATAGQVYGMWVTNTATATRFIKFYNATAANVSVGTTTPVITIGIPGNASDDVSGNFGPGGMGIAFDTAITVAATTGVADADTGAPAANDVIVNIYYK